MSYKPTVDTTSPAKHDEHHIVAKDYSRSIRISIIFKKGLGVEAREDFEQKMAELAQAVVSHDRHAQENELKPYRPGDYKIKERMREEQRQKRSR
jgi:hypothetical protein